MGVPMRDEGTAALVAESAEELPLHPVTVLSALVLRVGREALGDGPEVFAVRAGVNIDLVAKIEGGAIPAWDVPGPSLSQMADALVQVQGEALWTAVACDLLLTSVLSGDRVTAAVAYAEALGDPPRRADVLLSWALRGQAGGAPLLSAADLERLKVAAAELAKSDTRDAWVGKHLLELLPNTETACESH
jgi:hypothetical protein